MTPTRTRTVAEPAGERLLFLRRDQGEAAARDEAVRRYVPLALSLARPYQSRYPSHRDDIRSAALTALVAAAGSFDASGPAGFAAYARTVIVRALRDWLVDEFYLVRVPRERHSDPDFDRSILDAQHRATDRTEAILGAFGGYEELDREDERRFVREAVGSLDRRTSWVIARRYAIGHPAEESHWAIGRALKMDRVEVVAAERRGLDALRDKLAFLRMDADALVA